MCPSCFHRKVCKHRVEREILTECEHFEAVEPSALQPEDAGMTVEAESREVAVQQSICRNCDWEPTCTYPKVRCPVMYCEEYA